MTAILGVSAFYHDSAAALVVDGGIVGAAQEERFSRVKHDASFPVRAIEYCLQEAGLRPEQIDYVAFYEKPLLTFERLLETYLSFAPRGFRSFLHAMPLWLHQKLHLAREMRRGLGGHYRRRFIFTEHHESHAASAFYPSPFEEAAILTLDGVGEWATASHGIGRGGGIELSHELGFPHSLGLLYSAFTYFCGFRVNDGEYKLMGLAPHGEPRHRETILRELVDLKSDGSLRLDQRYFAYCHGRTMTSRRFDELFGGPPRAPGSPITEREADLAASVQAVAEEALLRAARHVHGRTGLRRLCLAGGVALNCVAVGRLLREGPFDEVWVQPAAGDAGGALGVALHVWHGLLGKERRARDTDAQRGSLLGPSFGDDAVRAACDRAGVSFERFDDERELCRRTAGLLGRGRIIGWMDGRMEFGPRALGSRSILADPRDPGVKARLNREIKRREPFRPFAPAVLAERAEEYFELNGGESPYMTRVAPLREALRLPVDTETGKGRLDFDRPSSELPAVTHVDYSARVQTVDAVRHGRFHRLLESFEEETGCAVLLNTSFNGRGEPIVCTPRDALRCFAATGLDALVLGNFVVIAGDRGSDATAAPPAGETRLGAEEDGFRVTSGAQRRGLLALEWSPSIAQLRRFALATAAVLALAAAVATALALRASSPSAGTTWIPWCAAALGIAALGGLRPAAMRIPYRALAVLTFPIAWLVSHLVLATIYHALLTPIGLVRRLAGRDGLDRRLEPEQESYWKPRRRDTSLERYFRQF